MGLLKPRNLFLLAFLAATLLPKIQAQSNCDPNSEFECNDGSCIPAADKCNDVDDCQEGEDEDNCEVDDCDGYKCSNGKCILQEQQCDGRQDCDENEDEENCDQVATLASRIPYAETIKIIEDYDDYSAEDYIQDTAQSVPDKFIVELKEATKDQIDDVIKSNVNITTTTSIYDFQGSKIIVRPEEAFIVIFVLILWMGAIGLFVHRWGKIRNCEPYAPKFEAELHRPSCPLVSMDPIVVNKRMSLGPLASIQCGSSWNPHAMGLGRVYSPYSRPRLNSVFVGAHLFSPPQPPRKTKSAVDIHSLLLEAECEV